MSAKDQARHGTSWEAMLRTLAADAVVADALLYARGGRRLAVDHGQPLTEQAVTLVQQLIRNVDQAVDSASFVGGGTMTDRPTSITWTFPSGDVPARPLELAAQSAADVVNSGEWIITADGYW